MVRAVLGHLTATPTRQRWLADVAFAILLVLLVWGAYSPSQKHAPRADQWCFLVDTMQFRGITESVAGSYSYNRTRTLARGDTDLYRPVLFAFLATEQWLFAGELWVYQTIGMIQHCIICVLLLGLLRQLSALVQTGNCEPETEAVGWPRSGRDYLPYALTGFFALNPAIQELVIWAHLHGYLFFLILLLVSLSLLLHHVTDRSVESLLSSRLWGSWVFALISAFTYEMGQFYAVLAGLFLAVAAYPRAGLLRSALMFTLFALILPIYQAANQYDSEIHRGSYDPDNAHVVIRDRMFTRPTITHSIRFGIYTAIQPFCPSMLEMSFSGGRMQIAETLWNDTSLRRCGPCTLVSGIVLVAVAGFAAAGLYGLIRRRQQLPILVLILLLSLYAVYSAMAVLGRMNLRPGPGVLMSNCYYTYTAFFFIIPILFTAWQGVMDAESQLASLGRKALLGGLVILTFVGGEQVRRMNQIIAQTSLMKDITRPVHAVNLFVKTHRHEPDFSIGIDYESSDDIPKYMYIRMTHVIFNRWISDQPKYWIAVRDGKAVLLSSGFQSFSLKAESFPTTWPSPETGPGVGLTSRRVGGLASRSASCVYDDWE